MVEVENGGKPVPLSSIPTLTYEQFFDSITELVEGSDAHCVSYFAYPVGSMLTFFCVMAVDNDYKLYILSHQMEQSSLSAIPSLTAKYRAFHCFERELHENFGVRFTDHPWLKPLRYAENRYSKASAIENYPFYSIKSDELHEVGVGPIHAGVIEPGHFRFICNGEKVLHLEIMLGYQHRGVERAMVEKPSLLQKAIVADSIAGDTAVGHSLAFTMCCESLAGILPSQQLQLERTIALELERIAIHIGDTGALCMDIAYQLGQVACEALRTIVINTTQLWCGNRFGKSFIRPVGTHYPLTSKLADDIEKNLDDVEYRYHQLVERMYSLPSILSRFEEIGTLTTRQAAMIGTVGMAARSSGVVRDIRYSHPFQYFKQVDFKPVVLNDGDILSRAQLRSYEVEQSVRLVKQLLSTYKRAGNSVEQVSQPPTYSLQMQPDSLSVSLVEGWRGEICHVAATDKEGKLVCYKVKDPSLHNWLGLALAVRNQEISDFPICNKSFNLSYCGHDL